MASKSKSPYLKLNEQVVESAWENRAIKALHTTWQAIGADAAAMMEGEDITQDDVRELTSTCGFGKGSHLYDYGGDKEAALWLESLTSERQDEILAKAFPDGNY